MIHTLIGMNPEDAEAHSLRCYILGIKGEFDEAMLACDTAILTDQNYAKAYLYRGFLWESHANPEKAQADYSDAVRLGDKTARLTRSSFLLRQGKPREAITDLNEVLRDYPSNWDLYVDRGTAWLNLGESEKALEDFTKAIQLKPNSPKLYSYRAWAYASNKSFPLAIVDYTKVLELSPDNLDALINRGFAYYVMEKHKEAIQDFSQAIKLSPDQPRLYVLRGSARNGLKAYQEAIADFTHAIQLESMNPEPYTYRGVAWMQLKNREKAIEDFNKALEIDPLRLESLVNRGSYWFTVKDFRRAVMDWEKAWSLNPTNPALANQLASFFIDCEDASFRDSSKALTFALSACEMTQWNNFDYLKTLAKVYANTDDFESAFKWMQRATKLAPPDEIPNCQELLERYKNNKR